MSFHTCWEVTPAEGDPGLLLDDLLARLAEAFPVHQFDSEGARQSALRRLAAMESLSLSSPVPEELLAQYRDAYPVHVILVDGDNEDANLDFTIWPEKDNSVKAIQVCFATEEHQRAAGYLLTRLAECLGWETLDVSDEVA